MQQHEFDCFGNLSHLLPGLSACEAFGLDYESARDVTPRWFGVSFGNGNNGVSQLFPDYYVRCTNDEAWTLARLAMIASFNDNGRQWAADNTETDGEANYTISATIYDPPNEDDDEEEEDCESWSNVNGAWQICEVFPVDEMPGTLLLISGKCEHVQYNPYGKPAYCSLKDCFSADLFSFKDN